MTRILLVEDDVLFRKTLAAAIGDAGWDCHALAGAQQCCQAVAEFCPDVVVVDWRLASGPGGLDVAHQLRVVQPNLPIILMTGYVFDELQKESVARLVDAVLTKPFRTQEFIGTIREVLASRVAPARRTGRLPDGSKR